MLAPSPWGAVAPHRQNRQAATEKCSQCNCRNSRCLKLYCECFASGQYCLGCNCQGCHNNPENNDKRLRAIDVALERCVPIPASVCAHAPLRGRNSAVGLLRRIYHKRNCRIYGHRCTTVHTTGLTPTGRATMHQLRERDAERGKPQG